MAKKIEFNPGTTLVNAVTYILNESQRTGEEVFGFFNGYKLDSTNLTIDSAYQEIFGCTKKEYDMEMLREKEKYAREKVERNQREEVYKQMVTSSRKADETVLITIPKVIAGLKFIAENRDLDQVSLVQGLINLGCNFTLDEINEQLPSSISLLDGMKQCTLNTGASVIVNVRDTEIGRIFVEDRFFSVDNEFSIYHYISTATGDINYTKEYVDSLKRNR